MKSFNPAIDFTKSKHPGNNAADKKVTVNLTCGAGHNRCTRTIAADDKSDTKYQTAGNLRPQEGRIDVKQAEVKPSEKTEKDEAPAEKA